MAKLIYKNISNTTQTLIGVGIINPGQEVVVTEEIVNTNFEKIETHKDTLNKVGVEAKPELPKVK